MSHPSRTRPVALITGASSGIGAACAKHFASNGYQVLLIARSVGKLGDLVQTIRSGGGEARAFAADLSQADEVARVWREIKEVEPRIDVLINNAGAGKFMSLTESSPQDAVSQMGAPYFSAFFITREVLPQMLDRRSGSIININSPAGFQPFPGSIGYSATRYALRGFFEALALDMRGTGVHVGHLIPAKVSSSYFDNNPGSENRVPAISKLIGTLTPEQVSYATLKMVERKTREKFLPMRLSWVMTFSRWFPGIARLLV